LQAGAAGGTCRCYKLNAVVDLTSPTLHTGHKIQQLFCFLNWKYGITTRIKLDEWLIGNTKINEEPDNRRHCRRWDQKTSWRHISSVDVAPRKRLCTFFYRIFPKIKHCLYRCPAEFSYKKPMTYWELCFWCMMV
jgi:hypothetical protein